VASAKRTFFCNPRRIIRDSRPAALHHRVLGAVALHDGMSLVKGKGGGCYASYKTLAAEVGCDYTNFSKAITSLIRWGYLVREPQILDRRKFTLRVVYDAEDSWSIDQHSNRDIVGEQTNDLTKIVGQNTTNNAEIVGRKISESRRNLPKTASHYISLKEELDFEESNEIDSAKLRALHGEILPDDGFSNHSGLPNGAVEGALQGDQYALCMNNGAHLAQIQRHLRDHPDDLDSENRHRWVNDLERIIEEEEGQPNAACARRLLDQIGDHAASDDFDPVSSNNELFGFSDIFEGLFGEGDKFNGQSASHVIEHQPDAALSFDVIPSGTGANGLGRGEPNAAHRALKADLDEFERLSNRASADLDLDAWLPRLQAVSSSEGTPKSLRSRAQRLFTDAGQRQARLDAAARAARRRVPTSDEDVDAATRKNLLAAMASDGWPHIVDTVARRTKMTQQALTEFAQGGTISSRQRGNIILTLAMISAGNSAD
jgi:hypothetical protein